MERRLALALILFAIPASSFAWWDSGHKIVALLAWEILEPGQQERVAGLLAEHERFALDFLDPMPPELTDSAPDRGAWLFAQASIWPDNIRKLPPGLRERYHRSTWHYINLPLYLREADRALLEPGFTHNQATALPEASLRGPVLENPHLTEINGVQAVLAARAILGDPAATGADRALMLCWLAHVTGDLHQPLHAVALFTPRLFPSGDRGGNEIAVRFQGQFETTNLHMAWDAVLGSEATLEEARMLARELMRNPELRRAGAAAARQLDPAVWIGESRRIAQSQVYTPEVLQAVRDGEGIPDGRPKVILSQGYRQLAVRTAQRRAVEAGHRLGAILQELF